MWASMCYGLMIINSLIIINSCVDYSAVRSWEILLRAISQEMLKISTVYPKKYANGFCFAVLCCGYTLTDFPISIRLTSLALWQSNDCPSASKATMMNMDNYFMWIHYERLHNHNKAKHNKTVCIFLGICCILDMSLKTTNSRSQLHLSKANELKGLWIQWAKPSDKSGPPFNIKMTSYQYRKSHCGDKMILRPSYLHNGISYTGKTTSLYWIRALQYLWGRL